MRLPESTDPSHHYSQANAVGQGFDIYGALTAKGVLRPLFDAELAPTRTWHFQGKDYLIPAFVLPIEDTNSYYIGGTYESREGVQNSFAAHAGVEVRYGAFSGQMEASFSTEYARSSQYAFAYTNFYSQLAILELAPDAEPYLDKEFRKRIDALPSMVTPDNAGAFDDFFRDFGIYFVGKIVVGGSLEFYTSVAVESAMSKTDISASMEAQYKGLFASGKVSADVKSSKAWQSYSRTSHTQIIARGGGTTELGALTSIDPLDPSQSTVEAFKAWLATVDSDAAVVDLQLTGIWTLCGDKREAVLEAWRLYGGRMRPRLTVESRSGVINAPLPPAVPPVVTIGGLVKPPEPPTTPSGIQVIVIEPTNISPIGVVFDRYYAVEPDEHESWVNTYTKMWDQAVADLDGGGFADTGAVLVVASFGLSRNMPPSQAMYAFLRAAGAGWQIQSWEQHSDPGSIGGWAGAWVGFAANYVLVGVLGLGPDTGVEAYETNLPEGGSVQTNVEVLFYRQTYDGKFTLGRGGLD